MRRFVIGADVVTAASMTKPRFVGAAAASRNEAGRLARLPLKRNSTTF